MNDETLLLEWQKHRCGACRVPFGGGYRRVLDHDHETGLVRGWLCMGCNIAEGCDNRPTELEPEVRDRWTWDWYRRNPPARRAGLTIPYAPPVAALKRDEARDRDAADTMGRLLTEGRKKGK